VDAPVGRDYNPITLIPEFAHPCAIFSIGGKAICQVDDLIALDSQQDVQRVGEMRR
jgi:hypothetical protein